MRRLTILTACLLAAATARATEAETMEEIGPDLALVEQEIAETQDALVEYGGGLIRDTVALRLDP